MGPETDRGGHDLSRSRIQLLVPVYNEGANVDQLMAELRDAQVPFDSIKFVYDFDEDTTLPFLRRLERADPRVVAEKNEFGRGAVNALRWGFSQCGPGAVVVLMCDLSDKLTIVPDMLRLWREGATLVAPSRYMPGGKQHGGGLVKSTLSRVAGRSLHWFGFPICDPTNNFKLYDGDWLRSQRIESVGGFEVALELAYKAFRDGRRIVELPTEWRDRTSGESKFRLLQWLPQYLKWYLRALLALARS